ncbi:MAG: helix-turn-helix domain-containing protein [Desulfurococcus sp.]|nr:helix-turn-helix domain-containing protein [Desulfurococcus sp.]
MHSDTTGSTRIWDINLHWVSKDTRARLIELMLSTRSVTELSRDLGISPTAIRKYVKKVAYPSDEVLQRVLENLAPYEMDEAIRMLISDLFESIRALYNALDGKHRDYFKNLLASLVT